MGGFLLCTTNKDITDKGRQVMKNMTDDERMVEIATRMVEAIDTIKNGIINGEVTPKYSYAVSYVTSGTYAEDSLELAKLVIEEKAKDMTKTSHVEAIVTLVIPGKERLIPGTGALLSRDRIETDPTYTETYRIKFDTEDEMRKWLLDNNAREL